MDLIPYTEVTGYFVRASGNFWRRKSSSYRGMGRGGHRSPRRLEKDGERGVSLLRHTECYGGPGADFLHAVIIIEELAYCNFSAWASVSTATS